MTKIEKRYVQKYGPAFVAALRAQIPPKEYARHDEGFKGNNAFKLEWEKACHALLGKSRYNASRAERYEIQLGALMIEIEEEEEKDEERRKAQTRGDLICSQFPEES